MGINCFIHGSQIILFNNSKVIISHNILIGMEDKGKKQRPGNKLKKPKWDLSSLPQVVRNFYREHPSVSRRKDITIQEFRKSRDINVKGRAVLKPICSIEESNFPSHLLELLQSNSISDPTAIQCQGWPIALAGRDLVAVAETGSGKTLGYLLPGIVHTTYQPFLAPDEGPIVAVLVPTRELAIQVSYCLCELIVVICIC